MSRSFANIAYTNSVRAAQRHYQSDEGDRYPTTTPEQFEGLSAREARFISERDSFYLSSVSESGWPYVQHRGGPPGFLKVIGAKTLAYADLGGNAQYVSVGNIGSNDRVALILMDYSNRHRLKIFGRARIIDASQRPDLILQLTLPGTRGRIERAVMIDVQASDWNCQQHITRRFTEHQVEEIVTPLLDEIRLLKRAMQTEPDIKESINESKQ